ncbi:hypothetical protein CK203_022956 [Vitis vinifera]|uniref:Uncharacterized protein n=1 Tax=Vitis vinifera TaxID=29760 RepID=A0A438J3W3_VITVI|nr:hypothetical protein CK203_022956 [Vitis vinifera]
MATMCLSCHQATYLHRLEMGYGTMGQRVGAVLCQVLSAQTPGTCKTGQIIKVKIVARASRNGAILVLSNIAFGVIANPSAALVNIEFAEA